MSRRRSSCTTTSTRPATSPSRRSRFRPSSRRRRGNRSERAHELMEAVRAELVYEPGATDVQTQAEEVLALGRGVCQDFAHVLLAACRSVGIPARYVSGYLYDPTIPASTPPRTRGSTCSTRARLALARPDTRPRPDRRLRPRRRRARLRRRAADARRLQGLGAGDARRARAPSGALEGRRAGRSVRRQLVRGSSTTTGISRSVFLA